jgi:hypothetical protein
LNRILQGQIVQRTSVKLYNDQFNEALALTTENENSPAIRQSYERGLKSAVRHASMAALYVKSQYHLS